MTNFSQAQNFPLDPLEVPREWRTVISRTRPGWWPIRHSWVPPLVGVVDALLIIATSVLADFLYSSMQETDPDPSRHVMMTMVIAAMFVSTLHKRGLYSPTALINWKFQVSNIVKVWAITLLLFATIAFALKAGSDFSRGTVLLFSLVGLLTILLHHGLWRIIVESALEVCALRGRKSLLLCMHEIPWTDDFIHKTARDFAQHGYELQLFHLGTDIPKKHVIDQVIALARDFNVEEIFLAADFRRWSEVNRVVRELCGLPVPMTFLPDEANATLFQKPSRRFGSIVGIEFRRAPLSLIDRILKRLLDLTFAVCGLVVLLPFFLLIALAIKLDSRGPVLFVQTRHGFNNKRFKILKFRTLTVQEDGSTIFQVVRGDSRVTRIGSWLRKTSIDELPQLFNVLKGDMSIVGPRPHAVAHDNYYSDLISCYAFRHHVKPGISGWAQIHGCRGETPTVGSMEQRILHDIWYVDNWSLLLDIQIILRTAIEVIRGQNAY
jgi:putative colanic acid biosynthesis UDP-glucose lipid carrier transferase